MRALLFLFIATIICVDLPITQEFTDYLKKHVTWKVADYEDNIFKGWTFDELQTVLGAEENNPDEIIEGEAEEPIMEPDNIPYTGQLHPCNHAIRNQGNCGSCWAFSVSGTVGDQCCRETRDRGYLSPQHMVSCDRECHGCNGGNVEKAVNFAKTNGLVHEGCLPYEAKNTPCVHQCKDGHEWASAHICKFTRKVTCSTAAGMIKCIDYGLVAFTVTMSVFEDFFGYAGGIYCHKTGKLVGLHAIKGVGYGKTPVFYIICANSWGEGWGEAGYFKIEGREACGPKMGDHQSFSAQTFIS